MARTKVHLKRYMKGKNFSFHQYLRQERLLFFLGKIILQEKLTLLSLLRETKKIPADTN